MTARDPLQAVMDLCRCMKARDYAGVSRLAGQRATLDGLSALAALSGYAAEQQARAAAAARVAEAERARVQAAVAPLLDEVIGILAEAMGMASGAVCITCKRALRRCRNCPYCGTRDAALKVAPVSPVGAGRDRAAETDRRAA